jgi:hypothetical protein
MELEEAARWLLLVFFFIAGVLARPWADPVITHIHVFFPFAHTHARTHTHPHTARALTPPPPSPPSFSNPLRIYFYSEAYLRFCAVDYSLDDLADKYQHLANNSIAKKSKAFKESPIPGNMWHTSQFADYLKETTGEEKWPTIQKRMQKIVAWSLMCVQDRVNARSKSCELYGYDFMIDDECNPCLIEVNSSPAMDYSTEVTKGLVQKVLPDCLKVMLDREKWHTKRAARRPGPKARARDNTGLWELIYDAPASVTRSNTSLAADLGVVGKGMQTGARRRKTNFVSM